MDKQLVKLKGTLEQTVFKDIESTPLRRKRMVKQIVSQTAKKERPLLGWGVLFSYLAVGLIILIGIQVTFQGPPIQTERKADQVQAGYLATQIALLNLQDDITNIMKKHQGGFISYPENPEEMLNNQPTPENAKEIARLLKENVFIPVELLPYNSEIQSSLEDLILSYQYRSKGTLEDIKTANVYYRKFEREIGRVYAKLNLEFPSYEIASRH